MALFDESVELHPLPRRRMDGRLKAGYIALGVALVAMFVLSFLPSGFVIQRPGPVVNTLGKTNSDDKEAAALIEVGGDEETYPTSGTLSLTTVQVVGNRSTTPSWFELAAAWFDPSRAVMQLDAVFPPEQTAEERKAEDAAMMTSSQDAAAVAALNYLGHPSETVVKIAADPASDAPSAGILQADDVVTAVNGTAVTSTKQIIDVVTASEGKPVTFSITRDGKASEVSVTPREVEADDKKVWRVGASLGETYDLPFPVTIKLNDIGGPSAGQMFALGIIDVLTEGEMTGGKHIAGTGTIDAAGNIGPIGGIRQKLYGARDAGNQYFLAPAANCGEVVGHIPSGLTVIKTDKLSDSVDYVTAIGKGEGIEELPRCTAE